MSSSSMDHAGPSVSVLRWLLSVAAGGLFALFLLVASPVPFPSATLFLAPTAPLASSSARASKSLFVDAALSAQARAPPAAPASPPRFAYLISGSKGDAGMLRRCLLALYHPRNHYILHLDAEAPDSDRAALAAFVAAHPVLAAARNVRVVEKANLVTYRGPTMVTTTLHAAAAFLWGEGRGKGADWDWFVNLSASDYPLVTQDDMMEVFSELPRDLNFLDHTSDIGWKAFARAMPVIIDPALYMKKKGDLFWIPQKRELPTAFKLFTGSAWMVLSRPFVEYLIWGWDNLPRTVLMYYANFISSPEGYFHTVACNADEFRNTTVNHDLHYIAWDNPPMQHPHLLTLGDWDGMLASAAPFARKFRRDDPVLDRIDADLLSRGPGMLAPGGWCAAEVPAAGANRTGVDDDPCKAVGDAAHVRPGPGAERLKRLVTSLLSEENFRPKQCKVVVEEHTPMKKVEEHTPSEKVEEHH
ncbi:beta-glucuronosyltransferase GlcAT14B-like [Triticum dicoccoides]|uniref:beta-glucuronosyltransferase GlcAT14B-like n=1 Tax=Triticum dicoccoides TaxID=85692 RepID=UPI00188EFEA8|nr:beta-glucuronosyltransferase GlcAT14B-like [Triticum dicoccoides]